MVFHITLNKFDTEAYLGLCQIFTTELLRENIFLFVLAKSSIIDVCQDPKYRSSQQRCL